MRIKPGITVVIPARVEQQQSLIDTIRSVESEHVREVVVVDDCSPVDIESWIHDALGQLDFRLHVHTNRTNLGPSIARNLGAQIATSEHLLFVDADVVFVDDCIDRLYRQALSSPNDIFQPLPETGHEDTLAEQVDHNALLTEPYRRGSQGGSLDYLYSYCFIMARTRFFESRGFSAFFTITHEDIEFGYRLLNDGVKISCLNEARVGHHHAFSADDYFKRSRTNGESFARLADVTGATGYRQYVDLIQTHVFETPPDQLIEHYRTLRADGQYDAEIYEEVTKHFWIQGIQRYFDAPVISVIIPVAGDTGSLKKTLRSLNRQVFTNFEVHLVHTAETDVSDIHWDGRQPFRKHRQTTGRLAHAMNIGRKAARGSYLTWVQCGDYIDKHYLRLLVNEFFLDQSTALSFCGYRFFGLNDETDGWITRHNDNADPQRLNDAFAEWNVVGPGFMVKTAYDVSYDEANWLSEDWDFFLQNALKGRIRFVDKLLYFYSDHDDSLSRLHGCRSSDLSLLERDQQLARQRFSAALASQSVCAGYVVRNESYFIRESILSVIDQVDEVVVIDTGSTDGTLELIEDIQGNHVNGKKITVVHRTIYNYNVSRFRNEVAELTGCDWIMIVDGDEIWPPEQLAAFIATMRAPEHYQTESLEVFQKRWSSMLEQQTNFAYIGTLIRAYRRSHQFVWRQSETIDFFDGERRLESRYVIEEHPDTALDLVEGWLARLTTEIEVQSVEYAYRNFDGQLSSNKAIVDVYFDHFARCKGDRYLRDRVRRIHRKQLGTTRYIDRDRAWNQQSEQFIPLCQHSVVRSGVSIIIPYFNNRSGLADCLRSIIAYTPGTNFEVLVINDNDAVRLELDETESGLPVRVIDVAGRGGFAKAVNLGMRMARYSRFCLCNDDVVFVSPDWASTVIEAMDVADDIAVAGPLTNRTGGYPPLQYEGFSEASFSDCDEIVRSISNAPASDIPAHTVLSGFCYFLKREAVVRCGLFDARSYPWGYGEENAYTWRLQRDGYRGILVNSVFVWHSLGQTFGQEGIDPKIDLRAVKTDNIRRVVKLSRPKLVAYGRARNEACLIEEQLRRLLSFCDEVVINDTGSTDDTVRIARSMNRVRVIETSPAVNYSAAYQLNTALQLARSRDPDWLLYFDMDQFYDSLILEEIDELLTAEDVDIWSFRLYDGRFRDEEVTASAINGFLYHTRRWCEPCYRVLPSLYRNRVDLMVAEPRDWNAWADGDRSAGVWFPEEHCVLPIQYIDPDLRGSFSDRRIANTTIHHLGNCLDMEDLIARKQFYTESDPTGDYVDDWARYPLTLPQSKLMQWNDGVGQEVDLGSHVIKYLRWDRDPDLRTEYIW